MSLRARRIRSAGPGLHLAPKAATHDGRLDFLAVREHEREIFIKHVDAHLAGRKARTPLTPRRFRDLEITSPPVAMHLDGKAWPTKKKNNQAKRVGGAEITIKPAALMIWEPASPRLTLLRTR